MLRPMLRLLLVPIAFAAAILAASTVLTVGALWPFFGIDQIGWLGGFAMVTAYRLGMLAAVPVLLAVTCAEAFRLRAPSYWLTVWVGLGLVAQALPWMAFGDARWRIVLYGIAGLVAGGLYWLVAGRGILRGAVASNSPGAVTA